MSALTELLLLGVTLAVVVAAIAIALYGLSGGPL